MEERSDTARALSQLASHVAQQLVAVALRDLARGAGGVPTVTVTMCNAQEPKLLPARTKRPRRRVGHRAGWSAAHRRNYTKAMQARKRLARPRATPSVKAGACFRCDHPAAAHVNGGACTSKGCVCKELHT